MSKNTETEDRLTAEWEPEVELRSNGINRRTMRRKLVTNGIYRIELGRFLDEAVQANRAGLEVRFTWYGKDSIRSIPVADKELSALDLICQSMGKYREALSDLKIKLFKRFGKHVKRSEALENEAEFAERCDDFREAVAHITPDMMVTCPECGTQIRIGKQLK